MLRSRATTQHIPHRQRLLGFRRCPGSESGDLHRTKLSLYLPRYHRSRSHSWVMVLKVFEIFPCPFDCNSLKTSEGHSLSRRLGAAYSARLSLRFCRNFRGVQCRPGLTSLQTYWINFSCSHILQCRPHVESGRERLAVCDILESVEMEPKEDPS